MGEDNDGHDQNGGENGIADDPQLPEIPLSLDAMLDLLANHRRRCLLRYFIEDSKNTAVFEDIRRCVIKQESIMRGEQPNHEDVQVNLQHHQLPKLADAGVIEYDVRSQEIRYRPNERLEQLFEQVSEFE